MISHKYKCIFIHIPKCAGTSIENALGHLDGHTGRGGQDHRNIRRYEQPLLTKDTFLSYENIYEALRRIHLQYFGKVHNPNNKLTVTARQYRECYKFTIVRNPWERAFSWYKAVMRDEITKNNLRISGQLSFNDALRIFVGKGLLRPQTYWIKDFSGSIPLDYIGRFENLSNDFKKICNAMGAPNITLPHKLKGTKDDYRLYYNEKSKEYIKKIYKEEIELFDYSF